MFWAHTEVLLSEDLFETLFRRQLLIFSSHFSHMFPTHPCSFELGYGQNRTLGGKRHKKSRHHFSDFFATDWCWALSHRNLLTESGSWAAPWRPLLPWHRPHLHASWPPAGGNPESSAMPICAVSSPNAVYTTYEYGEKWPVGWLLKNAGRFAGLGKSTRLEFSRCRHRPGFACWLFCRRRLAG